MNQRPNLTEQLRAAVTDVNESDDPADRVRLMHRIRTLRAEVAAAEAKIPRMRESIARRRQTISQLEARLAISSARPARAHDK